MAYLNVVAVASGRPESATNSILISVTDGDTGDPIVGLKAKAFDVFFALSQASVSQLKELRGIFSMNLKWDFGGGFPRGFHQVGVVVTRAGGRRTQVRGQTVCYLAVIES